MSVVGFDFGNQNCYVGVARQGGIEIITNDYSLRATPSCVSYGSNLRTVGTAAWQKLSTNFKNTVFSFKNLIGRTYADPVVQREKQMLPYALVELKNGRIGIEVSHAGHVYVITPEQALATLLDKLRRISEDYLQAKVTNCVLNVPSFWTDGQRRALLDACSIANISCLRLLNDTTAVALCYGIYKQEFPADSEPPVTVIFVDVGQSSTQISACAFHKGKLKMLGVVYDMELGGRDFDKLLYDHFAEQFLTKYKLDARSSQKATLRLMQECEKLKKQMTADPNPIPLNIDCFMADMDVTGTMKRSDFEAMCSKLFDKFERLLHEILMETRLKPTEINSVELIGGGSRLPKFRTLIKEIFDKEPSTTLNQDEAVARGCTLQSAMLSPAFRVREFGVTDVQPFSIKLNWETNVESDGETEVFPVGHPFPFSKVMTFFRTEPFTLIASYSNPNCILYASNLIGKFTVQNVIPSVDGGSNKIKVKVRINPNGIFTICGATMHEKLPPGPTITEVTDNSQQEAGQMPETISQVDQNAPNEQTPGAEEQKPEKNAMKSKVTELPILEQAFCMNNVEHENACNMEREFERMDRQEKETTDAKNAVEEYVYEMRDKLENVLKPYIEEEEQKRFLQDLNSTEDWLYDESEHRSKSVYVDKLNALKTIGDPAVERFREAQERPKAFDELGRSLQIARKAYEAYLAKDPKYDHWDPNDADKLLKLIEEKQQWFDNSINSQLRRKAAEPPTVFVAQINSAREAFERAASRILNMPKPEPPKPTREANAESNTAGKEPPADDLGNKQRSEQPAKTEPMDIS